MAARRKKRRKTTKRRVKRRTVKRRVGRPRKTAKKRKRKATPKQMAALRKAWAARRKNGRKVEYRTHNGSIQARVTKTVKKTNSKTIKTMQDDGLINTKTAEAMRTANRRGQIPMIRYIKHDAAGEAFAGEFIGPRRQHASFIGPIQQKGKRKKHTSQVAEFYD